MIMPLHLAFKITSILVYFRVCVHSLCKSGWWLSCWQNLWELQGNI